MAFVAALAAVLVGVFAPSALAVPSVTITSGPPASTTATSATFAWTIGGDANYSRCRLQTPSSTGSYVACASPTTYSGLTPGSYRFYVRAYTLYGWYATSSYGWTVTSGTGTGGGTGTTAPTVSLTSYPASSTTSTSASFGWSTTGSPTSTTCSLDGGLAASCSSPKSYSGLAVGSHSFKVTVSNSAGSASASYSWTITSTTSGGGSTGTSCTPGSDWGTRRTDFEDRLLTLVNNHRASLGLRALKLSPTLSRSAQWKALHMARYAYMAHDDPAPPVSRTFGQRLRDCGYTNGSAGENIAYGYSTPESVMNGWLNSTGHRQNLENASWTVIGLGAASYNGGYMYWAQNFGSYDDSGV